MYNRRGATETGLFHKVWHWLEEPIADEIGPRSLARRARLVGQFIYLVARGFVENRCPVRAAALSYTTLLAMIPLLAVVLSVSANFLQKSSADLVPKLLDKAVAIIAPELEYMPLGDETTEPSAHGRVVVSSEARQRVVSQIQSFLGNIQTGALGTVGTILLIVVAIRLLMTIEGTFNDIWGVQEGRSIWRKVVYYWSTISLGPLLLLAAMYLTGRVEFSNVADRYGWVTAGFADFLLRLLPFVVMWIGFTLMYALMPNTRVRAGAAFMGGLVAGTLWQVNSLLNTLYISRVVTYSKIYGTLGIIPIFLVSLYFSWMIVLFGAQVSFASQNLRTYLQQRASERFDHFGRELIACRVVLLACQNFMRGINPPSAAEVAEQLRAPLQLLNQLVHRLTEGGLLRTVADERGGLQPARPPESITVADVLHVVRTRDGSAEAALGNAKAELMERLLHELDAAQRATPANARFSDLVQQLDSARA